MFGFSPSGMSNKQMSLGEAYESDVPTLTYLDLCYGNGSSVMWLVMWISSVFASCGFLKGQITDNMKVNTANAIKQEYYYLNLNELVVFFNQFIAGKYNTFYGNPNPQVITSSLDLFLEQRALVVKNIEYKRTKEKERQLTTGHEVGYEVWKKMKEERGEEINMETARDENGNLIFKTKRNEKLESAMRIAKNTSNSDFETLCKLRECFIKKYNEDPFDYYKKMEGRKSKK